MPQLKSRTRMIGIAALALAGAAAPCAAEPLRFTTIALRGAVAPGTNGATYIDLPGVTAQSETAVGFNTLLYTGLSGGGARAIYFGPADAPQVVARAGTPAPDSPTPANYTTSLGSPTLGSGGHVAFFDALIDYPLYVGPPGAPKVFLRAYTHAPGTPAGVEIDTPDHFGFQLNATGQIAREVRLDGDGVDSSNERAIYSGTPGNVTLVARTGDAAPDGPADARYEQLSRFVSINDAGHLLYRGQAAGTGLNRFNDGAIYFGPANAPRIALREGDVAPDAGAGYIFRWFDERLRLNNSGLIAFNAEVSQGLNGTPTPALYAGSAKTPRLVARANDLAPASSGGERFRFIDVPSLNNAGTVVFGARVGGTDFTIANDVLLIGEPGGALDVLARAGDAAPGTSDGVTYKWFNSHLLAGTNSQRIALNDVGQTVFHAILSGTGVTTGNDVGLFVSDPILGTQLIVREGQSFNVGNGVLRTVRDVGFASDFNGTSGLADDGTIVFNLTFTDSTTGLFSTFVRLPGDISGDRSVDFSDLLTLAQNYGTTGRSYREGDVTGDGVVGFDDLLVLAQNYDADSAIAPAGLALAPAFAEDWAMARSLVPEPTMFTSLALAGIWTGRRRRRSP